MSNGMEDTTQYVRCFASLGNYIFAGTEGYLTGNIYLSTNNGMNWIQTSSDNGPSYAMIVNGNNIFYGSSGIYLSTDYGSSWVNIFIYHQNCAALATNGTFIFAGSTTQNYGVYLSTNNGINWIRTSLNGRQVISLVTLGNCVFAGAYGGLGDIFISTNNGTNWTRKDLNIIDNFTSFTTVGNNVFAGTSMHGIYLSTDFGTSWIQTALKNRHIYSFAVSGNNIFTGTDSGVFLSSNLGTNWINKNQGFITTPSVYSLLIANNYIFAGTWPWSLWRRPLSDLIGIQSISTEIPTEFSLSQNYPNPFNPVTKIRFDIKESVVSSKYLVVNLKVFDITGREIQTIVNEQLQPGSYEVTFDGSNLPSGVYFYQLRSGEFMETKKLVLLK
jgi:hypothetical protein